MMHFKKTGKLLEKVKSSRAFYTLLAATLFTGNKAHAVYDNPITGTVPDEIRAVIDVHTLEQDMESVIPAKMAAGQTGYLIVTTNEIVGNLTKLNTFIAHKESLGFTVTVITEDDYGNTATGPARATAIRDWMHNNYQSKNLVYALMIGNPNELTGDVPYHKVDSKDTPSDYPYCDVSGATWDLDGDGFFGVKGKDFGQGGADGVVEVYVGRMNLYGEHHAYANAAGVDSMLQDVIDFENETGDLRYRHDTLMAAHGSVSFKRFNHIREEYLDYLGADYKRLWHHDWGDKTVAANYDVESAVTAAAMQNSSYGMMQFHSHGTPTSIIGVLKTEDVVKITPYKKPGFMYCGACGVGTPHREDNIMTALTRFVGLGMVGGTRSVSSFKFVSDKNSWGFAERVYWGQSNGEAIYRTYSESAAYHGFIGSTNYKINLLGDPSIVSMPNRDGKDLTVSPTAVLKLEHEKGDTNTPITTDYYVKNYGTSAANYAVVLNDAWLSASETSFSLAAGASTTLTISCDSPDALPIGENLGSFEIQSTNAPSETRSLIVENYLPKVAQYFPFESTSGLGLKSDTNTLPETVSPAFIGNGLDFNSDNKKVWMAETKGISGGLKNFGTSFWVKLDTLDNRDVVSSKWHWTLASNGGKFQIRTYNNIFTGWDEHSEVIINDTANITTGQWYHIVIAVDPISGEAKAWKDGSIMGSGVLPVTNKACGWDSLLEYGNKNLNGQVDEVRLFFKKVTQEDVDALAEGGWVMPTYPIEGFGTYIESQTLKWKGPANAVSYNVYMGADLAAVQSATTASVEFEGNTSAAELAVTAAQGTNYWRVDVVTASTTIKGLVSSFIVDPIYNNAAPSITSGGTTLKGLSFSTESAVNGASNFTAYSNGVTMTATPQSSVTSPATIGFASPALGVTGSNGGSKADRTVGDGEKLTITFDQDILLRNIDFGNNGSSETATLTSLAFDGLAGVTGATYSDATNSLSKTGGDINNLDDDKTDSGVLVTEGTAVEMTVVSGNTISLNGLEATTVVSPISVDIAEFNDGTLIGSEVFRMSVSDPDTGDKHNFKIISGNEEGNFAITSGGTIVTADLLDYETASQYVLTVEVSDKGNLTDTATITINVTNVNEAPKASNDSAVVDEDGLVVVTVLGNDSDVDSSISVASVTQGTNGAVTTNGTTVTYTPIANFNGVDSFTYTVTDGELTDTATVSVTVNAVNDALVATNDSAVVDEDSSVVVTVLANDSDVDSSISVASVTQGTNGAVTTDGTTVTYTPVADFNGVDSFTYTITDGELTGTATVSVTVNSVVDLAVISTSVATTVDVNSATANYTITETGDEDPTVTLFYGLTDEGQTANWDNSVVLGTNSTGSFSSVLSSLIDNMPYFYTVKAINSAGTVWGTTQTFTTVKDATPKLYHTVVSSVGTDNWVRVNLPNYYHSMVIVATPRYEDATNVSTVTRITNVGNTSFDLIVQRIDDGTGTFTAVDVDVMVAEEGSYTAASCGVDMEAYKHISTTTAYKGVYNKAQVTAVNSYTSPVVFGQVMSFNDADWSVFWACDGSRKNAPDAQGIYIGKAVGEDPDKTRNDETLGYIIIESGVSTVNDVTFETAVGADKIEGITEAPSYDYTLTGQLSSVSGAVVSVAAYDGADQGAPVLYGLTPVTTTTLGLAWIEDSKVDAEQDHGTEQAAYIVFE